MHLYDLSATCPKCGGSEVGTEYCERQRPGRICRCNPEAREEHLHRKCRRCGYEWLEATVDSERDV